MMDQYGHKAQLCDALEIPYTKHQPTDADLIANFAATIKKFWGDDFGASCFYDSGTCARVRLLAPCPNTLRCSMPLVPPFWTIVCEALRNLWCFFFLYLLAPCYLGIHRPPCPDNCPHLLC